MKRSIKIRGDKICDNSLLICVPVTAKNFEELSFALEKISKTEADVIEWRIDFFEEDIFEALTKISKIIKEKKLLITFRTLAQGGEKLCPDYRNLLEKLISKNCSSSSFDMLDIELCSGDENVSYLTKLCKENSITSIVSEHFFTQTPSKEIIKTKYKKMEELGADIPKIAVMPQDFADVCVFMKTVFEVSQENYPIIGISMGATGAISRVCGTQMGSCLSFATVLSSSAPGQISAEYVKKISDILKG